MRPILVACIGYIIGILGGLYLKISIIPFYFCIPIFYYLFKKHKNIFRYGKTIFKFPVLILFLVSSIIANLQVLYLNNKYEQNGERNVEEVIIESNIEEKEYYQICTVREIKTNQKYLLRFSKKTKDLEYGDLIQIKGEYEKPSVSRNTGGFNYALYLKSKKIYGTIQTEKIHILEKEKGNLVFLMANKIKNSIMQKITEVIGEKKSALFTGIVLGEKSELSEEIQENFRKSSLSHILAVSGMHVQYILLGLTYFLDRVKIGKRTTYYTMIAFLLFFMFIVGFTPSVVRACIMAIIILFSKMVRKKADVITSIAFSLLLILIDNPFAIVDMGLVLSYLGTIGIVCFSNPIYLLLEQKIHSKILLKIWQISSVVIAAQIVLFPIMLYYYNTINLTFLIANLLVSPIIAAIMLLGIITIVLSYLFLPISQILAIFLNLLLELLNGISQFLAKLPFANLLIATPEIVVIILYFLFLLLLKYYFYLHIQKKIYLHRIEKNSYYFLCKYKVKIVSVFILASILFSVLPIFPLNLKIHFIDVGQRR